MKKTKIIISVTAIVLAIVIPFLSVVLLGLFLPPVFENSFVGALDEKVDRLYSIDEPKIVIIGGSSVAFGVDSELIERYTGMPVVNFGLYAALGTKLMLDLSRDAIGKDDVVIIAPELDAQTLSLYFSSSTALRAVDENPELLFKLPAKHFPSLVGASWDYTAEKIKYLNGNIPDPEGVYNSKNFNSYGDLEYTREHNVMSGFYDKNTIIDLDPCIFSEDFVEYLNDYVKDARKKGAEVYYSFSPINSAALKKGTNDKTVSAFEKYVDDSISAIRISALSDYVYDKAYFYDTNFHLNDSGVIKHSVNLTRDILLELGIPTSVDVSIPAPPPLPFDAEYDGSYENTEFFIYEQAEDGTYAIVGVKDEYLGLDTLTLPNGYDGKKVSSVGAGAFDGSAVRKLVITADTNIRVLENGCFIGADSLSELWIYYPSEEDITPPSSFEGTAPDFAVFVPEGSSYDIGYSWGQKGLNFETIK
jgi:hypothetical protein